LLINDNSLQKVTYLSLYTISTAKKLTCFQLSFIFDHSNAEIRFFDGLLHCIFAS